jgi:stalled ribosome rescue protein Dom34
MGQIGVKRGFKSKLVAASTQKLGTTTAIRHRKYPAVKSPVACFAAKKGAPMSACVVWMDSEHAKLFKISASGVEKKLLRINTHATHHGDTDSHKHNAENHFFHEVATAIGSVEELLVFGPGMAKSHFKNHLESHSHSQLFKHLVGVEPLDHMTDNQILESGRKFFKKFNTYNSSI